MPSVQSALPNKLGFYESGNFVAPRGLFVAATITVYAQPKQREETR
jgi:hypothetical protein